MSELETLFTKYGTDKGIWGYTPFYENIMGPKRFNVRRVLEIGICGYRDIPNNVVGASLFVWRDYFPNAQIYGIDNDSKFIFNDQACIHTACCDAYDNHALHNALVGFGGEQFDVIIDDAVHDPAPQINLMNALNPWLIPGGNYFMEDVGPYKLQDGNLQHMYDHIKGYAGVTAGRVHKPEVLIIGVK
jgi:hypothetical protein